VLKLTKTGESTGATGADRDTGGAGGGREAAAGEDSDGLPLGLGITGAILGALGLALRGLPRFAGSSSARTWLFAIARRVDVDHVKSWPTKPSHRS